MSSKYQLVLGLEVHLHLKTINKMFCYCDANFYDTEPNTHTCPVCLGLPGALPVPNFEAIKKAQLLGLALNCTLNAESRFDRKHYFYPDLPKGYQISQYKQPFSIEGYLTLVSGGRADIERVHLEEDTAKSSHENGKTYIDFNKSSMPLVEIVTKPTFASIEDAVDFCKQVQEIVRTLGIGEADMEKGQMRLEANISLRNEEQQKTGELPNYKVEIKNINSFKFMEKAVKSEIERQSELLDRGEKVIQENRGFNEATGKTVSQREKEEAHDYRYFPEPDIPPMHFTEDYINELKSSLPELPQQKKDRFKNLGLSAQYADFLSLASNQHLASIFNSLVKTGSDAKSVASLFVNKAETRDMTEEQIKQLLETPTDTISDDAALQAIISKVIESNPQAIADYKKGKMNSIEFMVGQVMRETKGKAAVAKVREMLMNLL
jgi:aspartyl-tRNA(Asn)/glutamyl-tRNA(Gln) amidotransferase subunit B